MTAAEMASFVKARSKAQLDWIKSMAHIGYSTGIISSMSLAKRRPAFKEVFNFPDEKKPITDVEANKRQLLVWAAQMNRLDRRARKEKQDGKRTDNPRGEAET